MWCICIASYTRTYYPAITPAGSRTPARWDEGMKNANISGTSYISGRQGRQPVPIAPYQYPKGPDISIDIVKY